MPIWTLDKPPTYKPDAVATERGWEDPETQEILVAIRTLAEKAGPADVLSVFFAAETLNQGDALSVKLRFNEYVTASDASILVNTTGLLGPIQLFCTTQTGVQEVVFDKQSDLVSAVLVPAETATLSVPAQDIVLGTGWVFDSQGDSRPMSNLPISADAASAAGTRDVV